jgi:anti-sigma factor RsiW
MKIFKAFSVSFSCRDAQPLLSTHIDGALNESQQKQLDAHLTSCEACRTELRKLRRHQENLTHVLRQIPRITPSPDFDLRVLASLELQQQKQSALLDFCDKLDAIFARPILRLFASSAFGLVGGLILVSALIPRGTMGAAQNIETTSPQIAMSPPSQSFARMAQIYGRDFSLEEFEPEQNSSHPDNSPQPITNPVDRRSNIPPQKEKQWNAILPSKKSDLVSSSSRGSLC